MPLLSFLLIISYFAMVQVLHLPLSYIYIVKMILVSPYQKY